MSEGEAGERVYIFCPNLETWNILWETVKVRPSLPWSINSNTCPTWREGAPGQLPDHQGEIVCMGFWASISFNWSLLWPVGSKIIKLPILSPIFCSITKLPFIEKDSPPSASFQISNAIRALGHITPPLLTYIRGGGPSMCPPSESPLPFTNVNVSDHLLMLLSTLIKRKRFVHRGLVWSLGALGLLSMSVCQWGEMRCSDVWFWCEQVRREKPGLTVGVVECDFKLFYSGGIEMCQCP